MDKILEPTPHATARYIPKTRLEAAKCNSTEHAHRQVDMFTICDTTACYWPTED